MLVALGGSPCPNAIRFRLSRWFVRVHRALGGGLQGTL